MTARPHPILPVVPALVLAAVLAAAPAARAHHSASAFDSTQSVSVEGVVTRYEWANPHVYIWLAAQGASGEAVEWQIEGQPPSMLRRMGWSQDALNVGDTIQVTGNPARNAQRKSLLLVSMKRADTTLYDGKTMIAALTSSSAAPAPAAADGLAGVWVTLLDMGTMASFLNPARVVPLTERGAAAQAAYDEATMNSALQCKPIPAPAFMFAPDIKRIAVENGVIRIAAEFAAAERVIHLTDAASEGATSARPSATPSVQGHSVGRWDGATLVVETTDFAPHSAGLGFSLASSPKKRLVERLTLDADGKGLAYTFELTDPEILTAPLTGRGRWVYRPDVEFASVACDLDNARRFTE